MLGEHFEEFEHELPMLGIFRRRQRSEIGEITGLALYLVEEARELARQARRLARQQRRGAAAASPFEDEASQEQSSAQLRERGRDVGAARLARRIARREAEFVVVEIAERPHPRQQQGATVAGAEKGFAEGAAGAARRQQDGDAREGERIIAGLGTETGNQGVEEGQVDRYREERGPVR